MFAIGVSLAAACSSGTPWPASGTTIAATSESFNASTGPATVAPSTHPIGREWRERLGADAAYELDALRYAAYQRLIETCMKVRGFDYLAVEMLEGATNSARAMNPLNEAVATEFGYHMPSIPTAITPAQDDSPEFLAALNGTEEDETLGCAQSSFIKVQAIVGSAFEQVQTLFDSLSRAVDGFYTSEEGGALLAMWAQCMSEKGYQATDQSAGYQLYGNADAITDDELRMRRADFDCDVGTALTVRRSEWEESRYQQWREDNATAWADALSSIDEAARTLQDLED